MIYVIWYISKLPYLYSRQGRFFLVFGKSEWKYPIPSKNLWLKYLSLRLKRQSTNQHFLNMCSILYFTFMYITIVIQIVYRGEKFFLPFPCVLENYKDPAYYCGHRQFISMVLFALKLYTLEVNIYNNSNTTKFHGKT